MKRSWIKFSTAVLMAIILLAAFPLTALASTPGKLVVGNTFTLDSGESVNDGLLILGGSVYLDTGSMVNGTVLLIGGYLRAAGTINGNLVVAGGTLDLAATFVLNGDLTYGGTTVNQAPGARINGQTNSDGTNVPQIFLPGGNRLPILNISADPYFQVASFFLRLFLWALMAFLVAMFLPAQLTRTSQAALSHPLITGGLGLLTTIVVPVILILLAITICLIPVALLGALAFVLAVIFGLVALGYETGKRISLAFKQEWHPAIAAGLGTVLLMAILNGLEALIPCVGWIPKALAGFSGLGAVLLTQFGRKSYPPNELTPTIVTTPPQQP